jgi:arginine repressor
MTKFLGFVLLLIAGNFSGYCQTSFDINKFFTNDTLLKATLSSDLRFLMREKVKTDHQKARFSVMLPDSTSVSEEIKLRARGVMRRKVCSFPPLRLEFNHPSSPTFKSLKNLKLVNYCRGSKDEQLLLKEYLIYKMFNLLTERSFRVRLLYMTYEDNQGKMKPESKYAFFIEDVDALAKRNSCKELSDVKLNPETTDREQMTLVNLFQYMIGNTDWSVLNNHNIKLLLPKKSTNAKAYAVPYDFDFAGLVNADYAVPDEMMGIENVTQRKYRGFPRTMAELQTAIQVFNRQKDQIYALVNNFSPLSTSSKKEMIRYLDDFFVTINNERKVQFEFIDNARTN